MTTSYLPIQSPSPKRSMTILGQRWLRSCTRHWRVLILFCLGVMMATVLLLTLVTPIYSSQALFLVSRNRVEVPVSASEQGRAIASPVQPRDLNNDAAILRSEAVLSSAALRLGLYSEADSELVRAEAIASLDGVLSVDVERESNIFRLEMTGDDPDWLVQALTAITDSYLERRSEIYQAEESAQFFGQQLEIAAEGVEDLTTRLNEASSALGLPLLAGEGAVSSLYEQQAALLNRLRDSERARAEAEAAMDSAKLLADGLAIQLNAEPDRVPTAHEFFSSPELEQLQNALTQLEIQRDGLLQKYTPESTRVRELDSRIALLETRIDEATRSQGDLAGTEANPVHVQLRSAYRVAVADYGAAKARFESVHATATRLKTEYDQLTAAVPELEGMRRALESSTSRYELLEKKHEELRLGSEMDSHRVLNVAIVQPPTRPTTPDTPQPVRTLFLAVLTSLVGSLAIAFALDRRDVLVTPLEVEPALSLPLLAQLEAENSAAS